MTANPLTGERTYNSTESRGIRTRRPLSLTLAAALLVTGRIASAPAATQSNNVLDQIWNGLGSQQTTSNLSQSDVVAGLKQALSKGTTSAIKNLGKSGSFRNHPAARTTGLLKKVFAGQ